MGQKTHPLGFRLGITQTHRSSWFEVAKNYPNTLEEDFKIRNAIEQWMNNLNSHQSNKSAITTAGQSGNLSGEMAIQHFDRAGNAISGAKWSFTNVYPVALGEIALDWGSNDTIEEFTIDFAYDYWTHGQNTPNL